MTLSLLLVWLGLALLSGGAVFLLAGRLRIRRRPALIAALLTAAATLLLLVFLSTSLQPRQVKVHIHQPRDGATVEGHRLRVEGAAVPPQTLVTLLVRSENDDLWWVQDLVRPDPVTGRWSIDSYLGTPSAGKGDSFSIVALASADSPLINFLLARRLRKGMKVQTVPLWNRSEPLAVRRER